MRLKLLTLIVCVIGGFSGYIISEVSLFFFNKALANNKLVFFFSIIWFIPFISTINLIKLPLKVGAIIKTVDQG